MHETAICKWDLHFPLQTRCKKFFQIWVQKCRVALWVPYSSEWAPGGFWNWNTNLLFWSPNKPPPFPHCSFVCLYCQKTITMFCYHSSSFQYLLKKCNSIFVADDTIWKLDYNNKMKFCCFRQLTWETNSRLWSSLEGWGLIRGRGLNRKNTVLKFSFHHRKLWKIQKHMFRRQMFWQDKSFLHPKIQLHIGGKGPKLK